MQTIREARIVIHLEQGRVDLKAPDISHLLKQQEQWADLNRQIAAETRIRNDAEQKRATDELAAAAELQRVSDETAQRWKNQAQANFFGQQQKQPAAQSADAAREAFYVEEMNAALKDRIALTQQLVAEEQKLKAAQSQQTQSSWDKGLANLKTESWDRGLRVMEMRKEAEQAAADAAAASAAAQEEAAQRVTAAQEAMANGAKMAGEGIFRIARAAVLLGASSSASLDAMVKGLARVQAVFDLFKGRMQIIKGVTTAIEAMRAAQLAAAVAAGTMTAAEAAATTATLTFAGAITVLKAAISPVSVILTAIAAALLYVAHAWNSAREAEKEAQEASVKAAKEREDAMNKGVDALTDRVNREREIAAILFDQMSLEEKRAAVAKSQQDAEDGLNRAKTIVKEGLFEGAQDKAVEMERQKSLDALQRQRDLQASEEKQLNTRKELLSDQLKALDAAEKELRVAKEKEATFQTQFGRLRSFEQERIRRIADDIRAGKDISQFDEDYLREKGGDRGENIANARAKRRGIASGANDVFAGIPDAMDTASKSVDQLEKALADLLAELKKGGTAIEARARIEAEKKELQKQQEDLYKAMAESAKKQAELLQEFSGILTEISQALLFKR
ncbi:hypothetical protein [Lacipirellula sp.]|uniref:hypothetical protein n=1 Tax=Lacipirellula sp. TaxID=2691419 RepID=UPI003D0C13DE